MKRAILKSQVSNSKSQIPRKKRNSNLKDYQNYGFEFWDLEFGI